MKVLAQDIKTGECKPVYLICGEEAFLKKSYKNRMKDAMVGDDTMNFHYFEGKGLDLKEIISLADTMPFFGLLLRRPLSCTLSRVNVSFRFGVLTRPTEYVP